MPFTEKDGHLIKAYQKKKKHDTASQLLKEFANRNWSCHGLNHLWKKIDKFGSVCQCLTLLLGLQNVAKTK